MIDINAMNVVTIGVICILAYAAVKIGAKLAGFSPSWL